MGAASDRRFVDTNPTHPGEPPTSDARSIDSTIARRARLGLWTQLAGIIQTIVLARVFFPADLGLLALATAYVHAFANAGVHGWPRNLASAQDKEPATVRTAFSLSLVRDAGLLSIYLLGMIPFARLFGRPELVDWLVVLAPIVMKHTLELPAAFLTRGNKFAAIHVPRFAEILLYPILAATLVGLNVGVHSLPIAFTASFLLARGILWTMQPIPVAFGFRREIAQRFLAFRWTMLVTSILAFFANKLDDLVVFAFAGDAALGFYGIAFFFPVVCVQLVGTAGAILFPVFARLSDDLEKARASFTRASRSLANLLLPIALLVAVFAEPIVTTAFGARWIEAAPILRLFAIGIAVREGLAGLWIALATSHGRPHLTLVASLLDLVIVLAVGVPLTAQFGAIGAAWSFVILSGASVVLLAWPTIRDLLGSLSYLRALRLPIGVGALTAALALTIETRWPGGDLRLVAKLTVCASAHVLLLGLCGGGVLRASIRFARLITGSRYAPLTGTSGSARPPQG